MTESTIDYGSGFQTLRRCYLKRRVLARQADRLAESSVWQAHQEEQESQLLPDGFPSKDALAAAGYTTAGDLEGATTDELQEWARLSNSAAKAVIAAYAAI